MSKSSPIMLSNTAMVVNHVRHWNTHRLTVRRLQKLRRKKPGPKTRAGFRFTRYAFARLPRLVGGEITEHGEVMAGEGADELVGAG